MEKLSKEEAIANHRKMWNWIADECEAGRRVSKENYFEENGITEKVQQNCWCCQYDSQFFDNCQFCPCYWGTDGYDRIQECGASGSPFFHFYCEFGKSDPDLTRLAFFAREIANLPEREDIKI